MEEIDRNTVLDALEEETLVPLFREKPVVRNAEIVNADVHDVIKLDRPRRNAPMPARYIHRIYAVSVEVGDDQLGCSRRRVGGAGEHDRSGQGSRNPSVRNRIYNNNIVVNVSCCSAQRRFQEELERMDRIEGLLITMEAISQEQIFRQEAAEADKAVLGTGAKDLVAGKDCSGSGEEGGAPAPGGGTLMSVGGGSASVLGRGATGSGGKLGPMVGEKVCGADDPGKDADSKDHQLQDLGSILTTLSRVLGRAEKRLAKDGVGRTLTDAAAGRDSHYTGGREHSVTNEETVVDEEDEF